MSKQTATRWQFCLSPEDRSVLEMIERSNRDELKARENRSSLSAAFRYCLSLAASRKDKLADYPVDSAIVRLREECREVAKGKGRNETSLPLVKKWCVWMEPENHEQLAKLIKLWSFSYESEAARFAIRLAALKEE